LVVLEILQTYPIQNSADAGTLKTVIADALKATGKKYTSMGLVLWSHGSAWLPPGVSLYSGRGTIIDTISRQSMSFGVDQNPTAYSNSDSDCEMDINLMANALSGNDFDFIMFDACFMSSIEVAYELRNTNKYLIASPVEILSSGFPYKTIVPLFFQETIDPVAIARSYYNFYSSQDGILNSGAICVIKSSGLDNLANAVNTLCSKVGTIRLDSSNTVLNIDSLQQFDRLKAGVLFDLNQFLNIESSALGDNAIQNNINSAWNNAIVADFHTKYVLGSLPLNNCNGISTYIPHKDSLNVYNYYKTLSWFEASGYNKAFLPGY
jgi:hypothetical protein